jgi:hypothetical protein
MVLGISGITLGSLSFDGVNDYVFAILTDNTNLYTIEPGMTSLPAGSSLNSLPNGPISFDSIGYQSTGSSWVYFNGKIPYFTYYNRALTPQEIQQNFNALRSRFQ